MKLEKDKQHLQEYERIQKEKELQNEMKLRQKNNKYNNIQQKQDRQKEVARLKAELRKSHIDRTLFQSQQIEQEKLNLKLIKQQYQQKIAKTLDCLEKYENGYHKDYLTSLHRKQSNHSHQIECVQQQNETILENKINKINQSLELRFKKSEDVLSNLSKQNSDRKKSEKIKVETYQQLVQRHQERLQQLRDHKGQQFDEKLNKVDQLQKLKEQQQKEKQLLRLEADKLWQTIYNFIYFHLQERKFKIYIKYIYFIYKRQNEQGIRIRISKNEIQVNQTNPKLIMNFFVIRNLILILFTLFFFCYFLQFIINFFQFLITYNTSLFKNAIQYGFVYKLLFYHTPNNICLYFQIL